MGKKVKAEFALSEDFHAIISMIPKLEAFIKIHKEIAAGYQKYRKNGGASIPGIEKHLGMKEQISTSASKKTETVKNKKGKESKEETAAKKTKKTDKI